MTAGVLTDRERALLGEILTTIAPLGVDAPIAHAALCDALERLAPHRLMKLRPLLRLLDGPVLSLACIGRFSPFDRLDQTSRERLLCALADSGIGQMRSGFQALKRLSAFVAYASTDPQGHNPLWPVIDYPGPRTDRPILPDPVALASPPRGDIEADAVVIGSGAGGGVAAALLAARRKRVVVLEAGPPTPPALQTQREQDAFANYYLESALTSTDDLGIAILAGSCIGGGTTINWTTSLRLSPRIAAQWSGASGGIDFEQSLEPHYDAISGRLDVRTTSNHNRNNGVLCDGCRKLGWPIVEVPRNASDCGDGCGYCGFGCAYGNKRAAPSTYLHDAVAAGASIFATARAERVVVERDRAVGVDAVLTHADGSNERLHVRAPLVVASAGSLRTPSILRRSGVRSPHLGRHLRLHPTTAVFAEFDEKIEPWIGPMQSAMSDRFGDIEDGYGAKFEASPAHPGLMALAASWRSREQHSAVMRRAAYAAALIVLTRDRGEGSVSLEGRDDIRYRVDPWDAKHMLAGLAGLVRVAFAAGANAVSTLHADPISLTPRDADEGGFARFASELEHRGAAPNRIGVFSAHQMGTCRMHRDPSQGVVDGRGKVHGVDGLYVADASVFPLASGVNPMLTIMALAHRIASEIA
jgi:choline dehydrogenase-like flavoprotein